MTRRATFTMMKLTPDIYTLLLALCLLLPLYSCNEEEPPLPDNAVAFESAQLGMGNDENSLTVKISAGRVVDKDVPVTVSLATDGVTYGSDFTTIPAAAGNAIALTIPQGAREVSFQVEAMKGVLFDGDEKVTFTIVDAGDPIKVGSQAALVLSFSEILAAGATMVVDGGGADYDNKVFIDLSASRQTAVARDQWDLGFYMDDDFRVIINSSLSMLVRPLDKTDLNEVTASDTIGFAEEMVLATPQALAWIDDPKGDLDNTVIAEISEVDTENKVYIVNRGDGIGAAPHRGWKKIRILRNGDGYTVQHADIGANSFEEIQVEKAAAYVFKYVLFESGPVTIEPLRERWDIAWTFFMNETIFGPDPVPYTFQDMIIQNRDGVETAKVETSAISYDDFSEADLAALTFTSSQTGIGSDWRVTSPPPAAVHTDRFYVIKDAAGNYYKLKFNLLMRDGVRGNPEFEYALVAAGG